MNKQLPSSFQKRSVFLSGIAVVAGLLGSVFFYYRPQQPAEDQVTDAPVAVKDLLTTYQGSILEGNIDKKVLVRLTISAIDTASRLIYFDYTVHGKGRQGFKKSGKLIMQDKTIHFSTLGECFYYKNQYGKLILEAVDKSWKLTAI